MLWGSRALWSCGVLVVLTAFAGSPGTISMEIPNSPSVVLAASIPDAGTTAWNAATQNAATLPTPQTLMMNSIASHPKVKPLTRLKSGMASWYGKVFADHVTASGRRFDVTELTAAHRDLPFGARVRVTDQRNHRSVVVTITDRGVLTPGRVIDLSYAAAEQLGMVSAGVAPVTLELLPTHEAAAQAALLNASVR
jgi:rare lipoprotein A